MIKKTLGFAALSMLFTNIAMAAVAAPLQVAVPLEEGGMLAIAAAGLALGIRIIQRKDKR